MRPSQSHGTPTPGSTAGAILLTRRNEREFAHPFGTNPVDRVWVGGVKI